MIKIKNGLRTKFMIWFLILTIIPISVVGALTYYIAKDAMIEQGEEQLKKSVDIAYQMAEELNNQVNSGEIAIFFAQETLREQLVGPKSENGKRDLKSKNFVIGEDDFIFAYNSAGTATMHPYLEGTNQHGDEVVEGIINKKEGYYVFETANSLDEPKRTKITYMRYFEPWDWIIVNGSWEDNFYQRTDSIKKYAFILIAATILIIIAFSYLIAKKIVQPINKVSNVMTKMGQGDFTQEIHLKSNDELEVLADNMNKAMQSVSLLISEVRYSTNRIASSAENLTYSAEDTNKVAKEVAGSVEVINRDLKSHDNNVENISGLMEELAASYQQISASTEEVNKRAKQAEEAGDKGLILVEDMTNQIKQIEVSVLDSDKRIKVLRQQSNEIGNIIDLISDISSQTNLLALNAAIEAARAGEHGRGFAVVADEVKMLAEETAKATEEVKKIIKNIQNETKETVKQFDNATTAVNQGIEYVDQTGDSFKVILSSIQEVATGLSEVALGINGMASGTSNAVEDINDIAHVSNEISSRSNNLKEFSEKQVITSDSISNSADDLAKMADKLRDLLTRFKV